VGISGVVLPTGLANLARSILVRVFEIGTLIALRFEFSVFGFEGIGDVLQKNEAEDDVLVLRSVHVVAERICHAPQFRFIDTHKGAVGHLTCRFDFPWDWEKYCSTSKLVLVPFGVHKRLTRAVSSPVST
jgi:hypothetical protein